MSSRSPIWDKIQLIWSLVAQVSHLKEYINSEHASWEDIDDSKMEVCFELVTELTDLRRQIMMSIEGENLEWSDHKFRCSAKHAIEAWQYANELYDAKPDAIWAAIAESQYDVMNKILSMWLNTEITPCWRCLADQLDKEKQSDLESSKDEIELDKMDFYEQDRLNKLDNIFADHTNRMIESKFIEGGAFVFPDVRDIEKPSKN